MMNTTFSKQSISVALAEQLIDAAIIKATAMGKPMSIAIVDESGHLKAFRRMDKTSLASVGISQDKAYTAIANSAGRATHEIYEQIKKNPATLVGIPHVPRYIVFGGGYPIRINGDIIGGIGVSGGTSEEDMEVAEAALQILA